MLLKWIKTLFASKTTSKNTEELEPAPIKSPAHFHIEKEYPARDVSPALEKMTKAQLDVYAKDNLGLKLDRRKKKDFMIEQIKNHLSKEK